MVAKPRRHTIHVVRMNIAIVIDWRKLRRYYNSMQCEILQLKSRRKVLYLNKACSLVSGIILMLIS